MNKFLKCGMLICGAAMLFCGILAAVTSITVGKTTAVILMICFGTKTLLDGFCMKE